MNKTALEAALRLARTAENFACRFTTNELSEADERQRQAVLDQIRLFKAAAEESRRSPAPAPAEGVTDEMVERALHGRTPNGMEVGEALSRCSDKTVRRVIRAALEAAIPSESAEKAGVAGADAEDAARWRAFWGSARFMVMGCAGFDNSEYPAVKVDQTKPYGWMHFGLGVWDKHPSPDDTQAVHGRNLLKAYVDQLLIDNAAPASPSPATGEA